MRELLNSNDTSTIKQGDSSETLRLSARNDNEPITWSSDDTAEAHVDTEDGAFVTKFPVDLVTNSNNVNIDSQNLAQLKAGKYTLEVWVKLANGRNAIYPSNGGLTVTIDRNADDIEQSGRVTTITLDDFKQQVMKSVQDQIANANLTDKDGQKVDLSDYAKKTDVPNIVYDASAHTLTINGQQVDLPADVDLSAYAKKSDVPNIVYDSQARTLTVNGTQVDLPANVDLSSYATKQDVASYVESHNPEMPTVDLTPYVKNSDLSDYATVAQLSSYATTSDLSNYATVADLAGYAKSNQVPAVSIDATRRTITINGQSLTIPENVDLSGYAKTGDVPSVKLDGRKLTVDGVSVDIPQDVDLGGYYTKAEVDSKVADAVTGGKVDLSGYVTVTDADKKYATKSEASATYATKAEIPSVPDVSSFITSQDVAKTYATKSEIPTMPDLSSYETTSHASATYATKSEIPDVSSYATTSYVQSELANTKPADVDLTSYVKKDEALIPASLSDVDQYDKDITFLIGTTGTYVDVPTSYGLDTAPFAKRSVYFYKGEDRGGFYWGDFYPQLSETETTFINKGDLVICTQTGNVYELTSGDFGTRGSYNGNVIATLQKPDLSNYATKDDLKNIKPSSSSSSSSSRELYGDIIPNGSTNIHLQLQFGMIRYTYTPKDGSAPKSDVIGDSGTISFNMLRQAIQTDAVKYDISFGFNNATKFTIPENTIQGTTTLDMSQVHVMSIDYDKNNWIVIHALIPNEEVQGQALFNGGQVADIVMSGPDRAQTAHMGTIAINTYPTITAQ